MKRLFLKMTAAAAVGALFAACGGTDDGDDESPGTLIDVAARSGEISAVVAAARRAGLESALAAPNANLTVLAPTNEAFSRLAGQLGFRSIQQMLDALPAETVQAILLYHVLPTRLTKADLLAAGATQNTLLVQGGNTVALRLAVTAGNGIEITDTIGRVADTNLFDIPADNGIYHVIDTVLIPAGLLTVLQTVQVDAERFQRLSNTVSSFEDLITALNGTGPFTLFAPVDAAFEAPATADLLGTLSQAQVKTVLQHHVLAQQVLAAQIVPGAAVTTLSGQTITVNAGVPPALARIDDSSSTDANVTQVDIRASNGVVHVIDKVLLPTL